MALDHDKADAMLIMRVGYYGIAISIPFILMRHWEKWEAHKTITIDQKDIDLCLLVLDIQYQEPGAFLPDRDDPGLRRMRGGGGTLPSLRGLLAGVRSVDPEGLHEES